MLFSLYDRWIKAIKLILIVDHKLKHLNKNFTTCMLDMLTQFLSLDGMMLTYKRTWQLLKKLFESLLTTIFIFTIKTFA